MIPGHYRFGRRYPAKGRGRRPVIRWRQGLAYGQGKKCVTGGRVDHVEVRAVSGKARLAHGLSLLWSVAGVVNVCKDPVNS